MRFFHMFYSSRNFEKNLRDGEGTFLNGGGEVVQVVLAVHRQSSTHQGTHQGEKQNGSTKWDAPLNGWGTP